MANSSETTTIFKSRNNIIALLKAQGYDTNGYEGASVSSVHSMFQSNQMDMLCTNPKTGKKAYVKYQLGKALRLNNIYDYIEDLMNLEQVLKKSDDLIIIIKDEPNESLQKNLKNIWEQDGVFVNVFNIKRLQFNILEHSLVPPHRPLSDAEAIAIKQKYHIQADSQLPDICRFSPVAQAIGLRPGQMCEIIRPSRTAINAPFYRICSA
jgi:DNA-directed RNA polymerase subunit H (RpoH/RPB5)